MIKCVVPISGGKDSQCCLELALEKFEKEDILMLFCDTGYEKRQTYAHIIEMSEMYGVQLLTLSEGSVYEKIIKYGRFPSDMARFCTDELKIRPAKYFYSMLARLQGEGFEVWYGMRLGESAARAERYRNVDPTKLIAPDVIMPSKYPKYLAALGVYFRLPICEWDEKEVLDKIGDRANPLYAAGFDRVGCFPCLAAGDRYKEKAFAFDAQGKRRRIEVLQLGRQIGKNIFTSKGGRIRNPDADPDFILEHDFTPQLEDEAPCFHCNI